jgi:hypothetical protein
MLTGVLGVCIPSQPLLSLSLYLTLSPHHHHLHALPADIERSWPTCFEAISPRGTTSELGRQLIALTPPPPLLTPYEWTQQKCTYPSIANGQCSAAVRGNIQRAPGYPLPTRGVAHAPQKLCTTAHTPNSRGQQGMVRAMSPAPCSPFSQHHVVQLISH